MKNLIKEMSAEQKRLKLARKTGKYEVVKNKWGDGWDYDAIPPAVKASWVAASQVRDNALRITAALNLYHEKRGSPYRHYVPDNLQWQYGKIVVALNNEVNALENTLTKADRHTNQNPPF